MNTIQISSGVKRSNRANLGPARPTLVLKDGIVVNVFYPAFLPDRKVDEMVEWLRTSRCPFVAAAPLRRLRQKSSVLRNGRSPGTSR